MKVPHDICSVCGGKLRWSARGGRWSHAKGKTRADHKATPMKGKAVQVVYDWDAVPIVRYQRVGNGPWARTPPLPEDQPTANGCPLYGDCFTCPLPDCGWAGTAPASPGGGK